MRGLKTSISDPDMGNWTFAYNAAGELLSQLDAKSQSTGFTYDGIGRPLIRSEPGATTTWTYDTAANGRGQLAQVVESANSTQRAFAYDAYGRPSATTLTIEGTPYTVGVAYDLAGRVEVLTYPTGFQARNVFNANNHLWKVVNHQTSAQYWEATAVDPYGQVAGEKIGIPSLGIVTERIFSPRTGRVESIQTGVGSAWQIQSLSYQWDNLGNLVRRDDLNQQIAESFGYDELNRLTSVTGVNVPDKSYQYNAVGNITYKSDVGTYTYPAPGQARPHAVTAAGGSTYIYDGNGNQTLATAKRTIAYNAFNKPGTISRLGGSSVMSQFWYGPDRELVRQWERDATGATAVRHYVGDLYEKSSAGSSIEHRHYIRAGDELIAIYSDGTAGLNLAYVHRDHLGSTDVLTDSTGAVTKRLSFDPWGRRRNPNWSDPTGLYTFAFEGGVGRGITPGFTGHKQLDHFELLISA